MTRLCARGTSYATYEQFLAHLFTMLACVWQLCLREDGVDAVALRVVRPLAATSTVQTPRARFVAVLLRVACDISITISLNK